MHDFIVAALIICATVVAMEIVAFLVHKHVMHGPVGWNWHRSHHEQNHQTFERNDLYALAFSVPSAALMIIGFYWNAALLWVGLGLLIYGGLYFLLHDVLVHHRWTLSIRPHGRYLRRLYQAHRLHHAVQGRTGCVSFGFLYAPPTEYLARQLKSRRSDKLDVNGCDEGT